MLSRRLALVSRFQKAEGQRKADDAPDCSSRLGMKARESCSSQVTASVVLTARCPIIRTVAVAGPGPAIYLVLYRPGGYGQPVAGVDIAKLGVVETLRLDETMPAAAANTTSAAHSLPPPPHPHPTPSSSPSFPLPALDAPPHPFRPDVTPLSSSPSAQTSNGPVRANRRP